MRTIVPSLASRERLAETDLTCLVLHATAVNSVSGSLRILRERGLSYHFLIDRDGTVLQLVAPERVAFHAGESLGPLGPKVNEYSVGISLVNLNDGDDPYPCEQRAALIELLAGLRADLPRLTTLTTHAAIAPTRKDDPRGFDAEAVAVECGLAFWAGT